MKGKFEDYQIYGSPKTDDARLPDAAYYRKLAEEQENEQVANDILAEENDPENMSDFVDRGNV